jgi:diadenosine tetraphosphate (Ap4A) HIT family hydrolase
MKEDFQRLKIAEFKHWEVYLHGNQYFLGRVYIWAKRGDSLDLMAITLEEREELFEVGDLVKNALSDLFKPDIINYAALGNITPHMHLHVIPRYSSPREFDGVNFVDGRWGKNYAPYDYDFVVSESTLIKIRDYLKERLIAN